MRIFTTILAGAFVLASTSASAVTPIHAFEFNNGLENSTGTSNGTLLGGATVANGRLILDGSNDFVQFDTNLVPTSGAYSVFIRVNGTPNLGGFTEIISQGSSGGTGFYIGTQPGGTFRLTDTIQTNVAFPMGEAELLLSRSATSTIFYINGQQVFSTGVLAANGPGGLPTRFGQQFCCSEFFAGSIDAIRIYNSAITPSDVMEPGLAVPEPASWAMLIAGFGLVGATMRRRRTITA